jgi:hypothetical protein
MIKLTLEKNQLLYSFKLQVKYILNIDLSSLLLLIFNALCKVLF